MQSHMMSKRRSEVSVAALRPLALNRATTEVVPARGTLFLKGELKSSCNGMLDISLRMAEIFQLVLEDSVG